MVVNDFGPERNEIICAVPEDMRTHTGKTFTLVQVYHHHKNTAVIRYIFEGGKKIPVVLPPHGNAKTAASYHHTQKSTLTQMKQVE